MRVELPGLLRPSSPRHCLGDARGTLTMDMEFSPDELAFRDEVRAFLAANLPERLKEGARATPGVFVEPDIGLEWHRILYRQGWVAPHWPKEDGGTGWT